MKQTQGNVAAEGLVDRPLGGVDRRVRAVDANHDRRR